MTVQTYKTKMVQIQAIEWTGQNFTEISDWSDGEFRKGDGIGVDTLEGWMKANVGDYIIKGLAGEFYPCKPEVFHMKYEAV